MDNVKKFKEIANSLGEIYEKKNKCYNNSFGDTYKKLGIISAVTRISDKYNRLCNLATNPDIDNLGESLEDTLRDMASYCIMTLMELNNTQNVNKIKKESLQASYNLEPCEIQPGDEFMCINDVYMDDTLEHVYKKGSIYISEREGCITDEERNHDHYWGYDEWQEYFTKVKK